MTIRSHYLKSVTIGAALAPMIGCSGEAPMADPLAEVSEAIQNGDVVTPWGPNPAPEITKAIVSLGNCTATVVQPSWVLTAKHCLTQVGTQVVSKRPSGNVSRTVDVVVPNPDPDRDTLMLHLSSPFPDMPQVPLYAPTTADIVGQTVSCYGYGYKSTGSACTSSSECSTGEHCVRDACMAPSEELRTSDQVAATYFTDNYANPDIFLTLVNSADQTILPGDSGGPCFLGGALAGVNSFGGGGGGGSGPGAQTSVPASRDWIKSASRIMYTPGDFNGDGKKDVIITNASGSYWYFSTGLGTYTVGNERPDLPLGKVMYTPDDFNGDGKTDLIITTADGSFWYYSTGTGTWTVPYQRPELPFHSVAYVTGDFNGDGKADFIETGPAGSYWHYSTGTGTWNQAYTRTDLKMGVVAFVPGDYNGDGMQDLIIRTPAGATWTYSTGTGTFSDFFTSSALSLERASFTVADFNGDGRSDFIITAAAGSYWYYPTASGSWDLGNHRADLPLGNVSFVPGDFNGDAKSDMIIVVPTGSYWYYSTGTGTWDVAYQRTDLFRNSVLYTPADFTGDGKSDVIISNASGSHWYYSTGTGTFSASARPDLPM